MTLKRSTALLVTLILLTLVTGVFAQDTTAWVRIAHLVKDGGAVDVFVAGKSTFTNVEAASVSDYQTFDAGKYSLAAAPTGKGMDAAVIPATDFEVAAGQRYTVAIVGQSTDKQLMPLIIDETTAFKDLDVDHTSPTIFVNNLSGAPAADVVADGDVLLKNVAYGTYGVADFSVRNYDSVAITATGDPKTELMAGIPVFFEPSVVYIAALSGHYPGEMDKDYGLVFPEGVSSRNIIDFLGGFSGTNIGFANFPKEVPLPFERQIFKFDKLLAALDAAKLTDMLKSGGPYTLFAPTDDAFALLPAGTLDQWMANPEGLKNVLGYHLLDHAMSTGQLLAAGKVTTWQGGELDFTPLDGQDAFAINQKEAGCGCNYHVANGYIFVLDRVLMPKTS